MGLMNHIKHFVELSTNYVEKVKIKLFVCLKNNYHLHHRFSGYLITTKNNPIEIQKVDPTIESAI